MVSTQNNSIAGHTAITAKILRIGRLVARIIPPMNQHLAVLPNRLAHEDLTWLR
jgi:hypothetical protein